MTRMASLKKDAGDFNQFRHHRSRNMGHCVSWEYYQPVPYLFTREGATANLIGHYRGRAAFMICNGPSLVSGRYDLNLLKSPGVVTYGINNGPKTFRPNFWTCVDDPKRFLKSIWLDPTICKIVPHAHAEKPLFDSVEWKDLEMPHPLTGEVKKVLVGDCPNVLYFHRNSKFMAERFLFEDTINWGCAAEYGGGRSVMLPVLRMLFLLGFRKVFMLGADFKMSENYTYHFDEQRNKGAVKGNLSTYDRMKNEYFPALKKEFDAEGFEVFNCTEGSELDVFPHVPYEDAINTCTAPLGDLKNERTWGLYSKPEERQKWAEEPDDEKKAHLPTISSRKSVVKIEQKEQVVKLDVTKNGVKPHQEEVRKDAPVVQRFIPQPPSFSREKLPEPEVQQRPTVITQMVAPVNKTSTLIKKKPCGPVEISVSSSKQPKNQQYITLPDDGK